MQEESPIPTITEIDLLKQRADMMGIKYHPLISLEKLKAKVIHAQMSSAKDNRGDDEDDEPIQKKKKTELSPQEKKEALRKYASELVRVNVVCMNPNKKNWTGEYISAGNSVVGIYTKFVQFNTTDGWHIPRIIYNYLLEKQCQVFYTATTSRGNKIRKGKNIREFNIELLPPLTPVQLKELAAMQAATHSLDD